MRRTVLVTGAGGFIGSHVCQRLRNDGWPVRIVRSTELAAAGCRVERGDQDGGAVPALAAAMDGCGAIVHLAARVHVTDDGSPELAADFHRANVHLTGLLGRAAAIAGIHTFVLMSSVAAVTNSQTSAVSDTTADVPDTEYGRSKLAAEKALEQIADAAGFRMVGLRPPMVYGEGMRGNPLRLFNYLWRGIPYPAFRPPVRRSMMYVGNLAEAVLRALMEKGVEGRYCLTDAEPMRVDDFARMSARHMERPFMPLPIPVVMIRAAALLGRVLPSGVVGRDLARLTQPLEVDGSRFAAVAGFEPVVALDEAIQRTARWFRHSRGARNVS